MEKVNREILLSFWKVHILHHAEKQAVYGQWMLDELRRHGYKLSPGTLYPMLERMEEYGWLKSGSDPCGGILTIIYYVAPLHLTGDQHEMDCRRRNTWVTRARETFSRLARCYIEVCGSVETARLNGRNVDGEGVLISADATKKQLWFFRVIRGKRLFSLVSIIEQ